MEDKKTEIPGWTVIRVGRKVDAFNFERVTGEVLKVVDNGESQIVIDLTETRFLSLPTIKFLASTAELLLARDGELVLLAPCNRTRRHIEIFANFRAMRLCMTAGEIGGNKTRTTEASI